jgi:hypothetical protein
MARSGNFSGFQKYFQKACARPWFILKRMTLKKNCDDVLFTAAAGPAFCWSEVSFAKAGIRAVFRTHERLVMPETSANRQPLHLTTTEAEAFRMYRLGSRKLERGQREKIALFVREINFFHHFWMLGQDYAF